MFFKPLPCKTRWEGLIVAGWIVLIDLLLLTWLLRRSVDWVSFALLVLTVVSVPVLLHLLYRTWGAFNLEYWVDRDAVTVRWAAARQVIPMSAIRRIVQADADELGRPGLIYWPGPFVRPGRALGLLNMQLYATRSLSECILLDTGEAVFALSPACPDAFLDAVQQHYRLGPAHVLPVTRLRPDFFWQAVARDGVGQVLLAVGLLGALTLFGLLMVNYPALPDVLVYHYNVQGVPDVVRDKSALFLLPFIGLISYLLNSLWGLWMAYRQQRTGAYLLWGGTLVVQGFILLALRSLIR